MNTDSYALPIPNTSSNVNARSVPITISFVFSRTVTQIGSPLIFSYPINGRTRTATLTELASAKSFFIVFSAILNNFKNTKVTIFKILPFIALIKFESKLGRFRRFQTLI